MSEEKVASRKIAIVLGITVIVLLIGLIWALIGYNNANATYTDYVSGHSHTDSEYSNMSTQYQNELTTYNNYVSNHTYTNDQYNSAITNYESNHHYTDTQYQTAQSQVSDLTSIVNLNKSNTWETNLSVNEGADTYWAMDYQGMVSYAGFVMVTVLSSTAGNTYVEAIYSHNGISFDRTVNLSSSGGTGLAVFPVLPTSDIQIRVGNSNLITAASQTISIYYTY